MSGNGAAPGYDVLVVGAGPTGLTLANLLGQFGLKVLVVERNASTVQEPRAVSIDDESLRTMQAIGLIDEVMTQVVPGYGSSYLSPSGSCFLAVMPTGQPYGYPRRNAFRQPVLERQLREGLSRFPSVELEFETVAAELEQFEDRVAAQLSQSGTERTVTARFMVGCDGAASYVRKALGFVLEGETLPERWLIVDLADSPAERDTLVFCDVARPCIALPGPEQTRRFEFKLFNGEIEEEILQPHRVKKLLDSRGVAPGSRIVRQTVYTFHARIANRWRDRRVLLAGDAAHLTPPFAGQGMNSGIRDAHNLAWKLAAVIGNQLGQDLLDTYEVERREHVGGMIDLALRMGRIMGPTSWWDGWITQTAFRVAGLWPPLRDYFAQMKYKPPPHFSSGFLIPSPHPLVGRLIPQPAARTSVGERALLDDLLPAGFVLLGIDQSCETVEGAAKRLDTGRVNLSPVSLCTGRAQAGSLSLEGATELTQFAGSVMLLRPDRYVVAVFPVLDDGTRAAVPDLFNASRWGDIEMSAQKEAA